MACISRRSTLLALIREAERGNSAPVRINPLIHVNPQHTRHPRQDRRQRQKQHNPAHHALHQRPPQHSPHQYGQQSNRAQSQPVANVHRSEKVAVLSLKLQPTHRTALVHSRKLPHRFAEDFSGAASRTQPVENPMDRRNVGPLHERKSNRQEIPDILDICAKRVEPCGLF